MKRLDFPLTAGVVLLAVLASAGLWLHEGPLYSLADLFVADTSRIAAGQLWRLVTGPLVHTDGGQAGRDLFMGLLVGLVYERQLGPRFKWLLALCLVVPTAVALGLRPELGAYFGLSGAVNGLFSAALLFEWQQADGKGPLGRAVTIGLLLLHGAKLLFESLTGGMLMPMELASGVTPLPEAHLAGAITGVIFMLTTSRPFDSALTASHSRT